MTERDEKERSFKAKPAGKKTVKGLSQKPRQRGDFGKKTTSPASGEIYQQTQKKPEVKEEKRDNRVPTVYLKKGGTRQKGVEGRDEFVWTFQ